MAEDETGSDERDRKDSPATPDTADDAARSDDPFAAFDPVEDRDGDPFEELDAPPDGSATGSDGETLDDSTEMANDGLPPGPEGSAGDTDSSQPDATRGAADPFADVAGRDGDPFGDEDSVFERVDVGAIDVDSVWETLGEERSRGTDARSQYTDVSKHRYCEQCEFFSAPPDVRCTNEGTEIVEFLDMETVRLLDCPVVAEQRAIERQE